MQGGAYRGNAAAQHLLGDGLLLWGEGSHDCLAVRMAGVETTGAPPGIVSGVPILALPVPSVPVAALPVSTVTVAPGRAAGRTIRPGGGTLCAAVASGPGVLGLVGGGWTFSPASRIGASGAGPPTGRLICRRALILIACWRTRLGRRRVSARPAGAGSRRRSAVPFATGSGLVTLVAGSGVIAVPPPFSRTGSPTTGASNQLRCHTRVVGPARAENLDPLGFRPGDLFGDEHRHDRDAIDLELRLGLENVAGFGSGLEESPVENATGLAGSGGAPRPRAVWSRTG
jgi:hypothetical protein